MHLPIPCTPSVEIPHFLGFSSKFSNSSPTCSLYLLSLFVFAILGAAALVKLFLVRRARTKQERNTIQKSEKEQSFQRRTFSSFVKGWDGINWPVTLTAPPSTAAVGRGVGLNGAVLGKQMQQPVRNGVSCDQSFERANINGQDDNVAPYFSPAIYVVTKTHSSTSTSPSFSLTSSTIVETTIYGLNGMLYL
ncbi:hypothetical protein EV360DRAFT_87687 [Lentinula raphanica]|nr:hypothetical protein EV360DRAFT_87687 [Lentinula raphanica]